MKLYLCHGFVAALIAAVCLTGVTLLTGCAASAFEVKVTAISDGQSIERSFASFRLVPVADSAVERAALRDAMEVADTALKRRGLRAADGASTPDLFVGVSCGLVDGASRVVTTLLPTYSTVPGPIRMVTQQVGTAPNGAPIYQQVVVQDPPIQIVTGHITERSEVKVMKKYFRLVAFRNDPSTHSAPQVPAWAVQSIIETEDSALKRMLPVLAAAGTVFLGQDTKGAVTIHMKESDPDVSALRTRTTR